MFGGLAFLYRGRMCCGIVGSESDGASPRRRIRCRHARTTRAADGFHGQAAQRVRVRLATGFRTAAALRTWLSRGERAADEKTTGQATGRSMRPHPPRTTAATLAGHAEGNEPSLLGRFDECAVDQV